MKAVSLYGHAMVLFLFVASPLMAGRPFVLEQNKLDGQYLGAQCDLFVDKTKQLTIDDVRAPAIAARFQPSEKKILQLAGNMPLWARLAVSNPTLINISWYLEFDYCFGVMELFVPQGNSFRVHKIDNYQTYRERRYKSVSYVFPLTEKPGSQVYYMRFTHPSLTSVPLRAWSDDHLLAKISLQSVGYGLFYGILAIMFLYNLFIYGSVRESAYLLYLVKIFFFCLHYSSLDGTLVFYFGSLFSRKAIDYLFAFSYMGALTAGIFFTRSYLGIKSDMPKFDRFFIVLGIIPSLLFFWIDVIGQSYAWGVEVYMLYAFIVIMVVIGVAIRSVIRGSRSARFFLAAYALYLLACIIRICVAMDIVPTNPLTIYSVHSGVVIMMILFSLGLADKINMLKNELADLNKNLEYKVLKRTEELKEALQELSMTNEQLIATRDALWGEMRLARKIQTSLLPDHPVVAGYEVTGYMQPASEVGGDYYDVIHAGGKDWLVIGDVSGHGVSAGLVMMMVQTAMRSLLESGMVLKPDDLLIAVNKTIYHNIRKLGDSKYMTITVFACMDNGQLHFSGLHLDIIIYRSLDRQVELVATHGFWLGVVQDVRSYLEEGVLTINPGDVMVLYTDGITEARDQNGSMYSAERLAELVKQHGHMSTEEVKSAILESLAGYTCRDDVALLIMKRQV